MVYIRGQAADYDGWAAEGNPGWGFDDVLPYFKRSEHNTRGPDAWHGSGGPLQVQDLLQANRCSSLFIQAGQQAGHGLNPDFNGASQEGVGPFQVTHRHGERCSAAKGYLTPALGRPNLQVITGAQATQILFDGKRATGVEYLQNGTRHRVQARAEVLLSAGALQSPQLLMLSGVGPGAHLQAMGIPVLHDLPGVGQALHDHVDVVQVVDAPKATDLFGLSLIGLRNAISGMLEWRRHRSGTLTTNFAEAGGFIRSSPEQAAPDLQLHFVIGKLSNHGRNTVFGHGYSCHVCLLNPASRGSLKLASADPLAAPLIDPAFLTAPSDLDRMVKGVKRMRQILSQPALVGLGGRESAMSASARSDEQIAAVMERAREEFGTIDFLVHSIAFAGKEELMGSMVANTSREGFRRAMDISVYSFIDCSRRASELMTDGGAIICMTYLGAERTVPSYNVMGVAKAALEASTRYAARDLGPKGIRVNAISAGAMRTLSLAGIRGGKSLMSTGRDWSLLKEDTSMEGVAGCALYLLSPIGRSITGEVVHVDAGFHMVGLPDGFDA
jgi:enoyl-[acyl-carrier-protein] reductase (NADH)